MVDHDNKTFTAKYDLFKVDTHSSTTDYQFDLESYAVRAGIVMLVIPFQSTITKSLPL